ncbi:MULTISPECIES: metal ABC transporter substrate-binding protein [Dermabacter]|uniref:metal ABC transporter substrate-binding protein n=1 Tax=Dermabacter TaxID=36739 RepID=UPI00223BE610|nr:MULTISPECIES: metal ABC transporter substrate-binding protein [Dermabacter]MCT1806833.1 metal ABC transporter substrate-binding protein [Dermabacter hominis]MCT1954665.1 metal ABC transporter substrate-binding protein [Dermabacter hominis]MCT2025623.1 metal ABC transporter substrate-binding protein [Dermabacter hominis]MCT2055478.1 metal ABC transporter substrate-binding protein [Dermabacter hominis]MCT2083040.1 metal ABC transporter substrate-binding protein [Dermabacter hominis]
MNDSRSLSGMPSPISRRAFTLGGGLSLAAVLAGCGGTSGGAKGSDASSGSGDVSVMITCYPTQYLAEKIGGKHVSIINPVKPGIDPHGLELSVQQVAQMADADLVVQIEHYQTAVDDAIKAHKPKKLLNLNEFVDILPASGEEHEHEHGDEHAHEHEHEHDHEHEASDGGGEHEHEHEHDEHSDEHDHEHGGHEHHHDHGGIDPHFWQDPHRMIKAAKALADTLSEVDADHAEDYAKNYESLEKELTKLDEELHEKYDSVTREKAFITSHTAFAYLAKTYDLHQIGIAGIDPENEPSTERLLELADLVKKEKLTTVFFETSATPAVAEALASRTGAKAEELDNLETQLDAKKDYAQVMRDNADKLVASWQ